MNDHSLTSSISGLFEGLDWISAESVIYRAQHTENSAGLPYQAITAST